jgi:tryptophan 2,3-dioxygenase
MNNEQIDCTISLSILSEVESYLGSRSNLPVSEEHATAKLIAKSLTPSDIADRREAFVTNSEIDPTAVLANYELLHGVKYLKQLGGGDDAPLAARASIAVFRAAEICLHNLTVLAEGTTDDLDQADGSESMVKTAWANHFHETLYTLSQLLIKLDNGNHRGDAISIRHSKAFSRYLQQSVRMHDALRNRLGESISDIAQKDLDDNRRYTGFHSYVNTNYEMIWMAVFDSVRLSGVRRGNDETDEVFYERVIQDDMVRDAVQCVDLEVPTYLMQFRAYHQISEVLVSLVNEIGCDVIVRIVSRTAGDYRDDVEALVLCNRLLDVVTDNIRPIVRTLSPKAYFAIRPALGITSGSHSHNLRKGLFLTVYPLLVRAARLMVVGFDGQQAKDNATVLYCATKLLESDNKSAEAAIVRNVVYVHQYVRTWRDEHMQFVKTQIGMSPDSLPPTASISGAESAAQSADNFRKAHNSDLVAPLYEAVLGKCMPMTLPVVREGGFDEYMANLTAEAARSMYADVQSRSHRRRQV